MPITKKVKFEVQDKTTQSSTNSTDWAYQGTVLDASKQTAGNDYLAVLWVNCVSSGTNAGATKFSMKDGGGDIEGSVQQRHDTNSSGMYVGHIGQFTAASPPQDIAIYRKRITGSANELTHYGQGFVIDLSYSGLSGGLATGVDYASSVNHTSRTVNPNQNWHMHVNEQGSGDFLILAAAKVSDSKDTVLVGLDVNGTLVSSGSRFTQSAADTKEVLFAGFYNIPNNCQIKLDNKDGDPASCNYSYVFAMKLGTPAPYQSNVAYDYQGEQKSSASWSNHGTSGTYGTSIMNGSNDPSFVIAMGRQTSLGADSGRMASVTLRNRTKDEFMLFSDRSEGAYDPLYFPYTNVGDNRNQLETAVIVGTGNFGPFDNVNLETT